MTQRVTAAMSIVARLGAARAGAVGVLVVAGGVATAQPLTGTIRFQVSYDGSSWSNEIGVDNGMAFKIRALAEWTDGSTPSVGFAGATLEQIDLIGARMSDDEFDLAGAYRKQGTDETWSLQAGTGASAGWTKIDRLTNPVLNNVNFGQFPKVPPPGIPNPFFDGSNPLVVFEMNCRYGMTHGDNIMVTGTWWRSGSPATNQFRVYVTDAGTNKAPAMEAVMIPALVRYVGPSPGTAGAFVFAGALGARRRKR